MFESLSYLKSQVIVVLSSFIVKTGPSFKSLFNNQASPIFILEVLLATNCNSTPSKLSNSKVPPLVSSYPLPFKLAISLLLANLPLSADKTAPSDNSTLPSTCKSPSTLNLLFTNSFP